MNKRSASNRLGLLWLPMLVLLVIAMPGCEAGRFLAYAIAGDGEKTVHVKAQYTGLENQSFAVLVAADDYTSFTYPGASLAIARGLTANIATGVQGSRPMDPTQVIAFQKENPYWLTVPYDQIIQRLGVDRLVIVDLVEFSLREPGNSHVWQGQLVANVGVAEANANDGNRLVFSTTVKSRFPDNDSRVGVLNSSDKSIQLGLVANFSQQAANLFIDHEEVRK